MPPAKRPKALPRYVPGQKPNARRTVEVNLPGVGASLVIQEPSLGAWSAANDVDGTPLQEAVAMAAVCIIEPDMSGEDLLAAATEWPLTDWLYLQEQIDALVDDGEESLRAAQREFRASGDGA